MIVQEASLKDSENILELEKEIWNEYVTTKWDIATFIRFGQVLVVYENEKLIAALISIITKNDELYIVDLLVNFQYRRQGIATKLYEYLFKMFDKKIIADVSVKHNEALILHETLGFVQTNSDSNWYGLGKTDETRLIFHRERTEDYDVDYARDHDIERKRLQKEDDKRELKEMQKKNKLSERLLQWAQNCEMIDKYYTDHGKDCLEAAKIIESFEKFNHLKEWDII